MYGPDRHGCPASRNLLGIYPVRHAAQKVIESIAYNIDPIPSMTWDRLGLQVITASFSLSLPIIASSGNSLHALQKISLLPQFVFVICCVVTALGLGGRSVISIDSVPVTSRSDIPHRGHISGVWVFNCWALRLVVPTCPFCAPDFFDLPDFVFLGLSLCPICYLSA